MTAEWPPPPSSGPPPTGHGSARRGVSLNAGRLWAGAVATAVVAALIAVAGIAVARGIFDVPVLAPKGSGTWGNSTTATYALGAVIFSLLACALLHVLLLSTPSPFMFFGWILALCTLVATLAPFSTGAELSAKVATAIINVLIGIAVWSLLASTARRSYRRIDVARPRP